MIDRYALVIGAMKGGTTSLFKALATHPEVAAASEKEPDFWCDAEVRARGLGAYEGLFGWDPERHLWALESSTRYAKLPSYPSACAVASQWSYEFRFVYVVRDPVERIRSEYLHSFASGWITKPIAEGLLLQPLMTSSYGYQILPYVRAFGRERIHVVRYEDFRDDPLTVLRRIAGFLGIAPSFAFAPPGWSNSGDFHLRRLLARLIDAERLLPAPVSPIAERVRSYDVLRERCRVALAAAGAEVALERLERRIEHCILPSPEQAREIRRTLREDLARFCDEWGLPAWEDEREPAELAGV